VPPASVAAPTCRLVLRRRPHTARSCDGALMPPAPATAPTCRPLPAIYTPRGFIRWISRFLALLDHCVSSPCGLITAVPRWISFSVLRFTPDLGWETLSPKSQARDWGLFVRGIQEKPARLQPFTLVFRLVAGRYFGRVPATSDGTLGATSGATSGDRYLGYYHRCHL
jgi:hypothetical protein